MLFALLETDLFNVRHSGLLVSPPMHVNDTTDRPLTAMTPMTFPLGYHHLHPDTSINFQMNRWFGWVDEPDMLEEMRMAAPRRWIMKTSILDGAEFGVPVTNALRYTALTGPQAQVPSF